MRPSGAARLASVLQRADVADAIARSAIAASVFAHAIRSMIGEAGWLAIVVSLGMLGLAVIVVRDRDARLPALLPVTVWIYLTWATVSLVWSWSRVETLLALLPLLGLAAAGAGLATIRDPAQVFRAVTDVMRLAIGASLIVEVLSGVVLNIPFEFLGVRGDIAVFGAVQGVMDSPERLGILALVGGISFAVEWSTRAVDRRISMVSLVAALVTLVLAQSGLAWFTAAVAAIAATTLLLLRQAHRNARIAASWTVVAVLTAVGIIVWVMRSAVLAAIDSTIPNDRSIDVWQAVWSLIELKPVTGWGWIGTWDAGTLPYEYITARMPGGPASASNAALDLLLQLGAIGLLTFGAMVALALMRAWRDGIAHRPVIALWPVLVLTVLGCASVADSLILTDWGWLMLVIVATSRSSAALEHRALRARLRRSAPRNAGKIAGDFGDDGSPAA